MKKVRGEMIELFVLILVAVLLASFGQIFMKRGLREKPLDFTEILSPKIFSTVFEPNVFIGLALYLISAVFYLTILSKAEISFAYPMISLGYIITAFLSRYYFNESIPPLRWVGIMVILGGVFLISRT